MVVVRNFSQKFNRKLNKKYVTFTVVAAIICYCIHKHATGYAKSVWILDEETELKWAKATSEIIPVSTLAFYFNLFSAVDRFRPMDPPKDILTFRNKEKCIAKGDLTMNDRDLEKVKRISFENLDACYHFPPKYLSNLKEMHAGYLETIRTIPSSITKKLYSKEKGIVTVGGGKYSVIAASMLARLRKSGTTLPVQVFIPEEDQSGESDFCNRFAPLYNAKCVYISDYLSAKTFGHMAPKRFQYKILAIILSSFKDVLFLDSDNYPMKNIDNIFDTEAYNKYGMISWPDIWRRVTAPGYYEIAGSDVDFTKRVRNQVDDVTPVSRYQNADQYTTEELLTSVPFHDLQGTLPDLTSESGQILIDKEKHFDTLLLVLYYNIYGPEWYYRIFTQGGAGEGDKETFVAAAHALGKPYYQTKTVIEFSGFSDKGGYNGVGLFQHDFEQDYQLYKKAIATMEAHPEEYSQYDPNYRVYESFLEKFFKPEELDKQYPDVMFTHASFSKFSPYDLYKEKKYFKDKEQFRGFSGRKRMNGVDFELDTYQSMKSIFCGNENYKFAYLEKKIKSEKEKKEMCKYLQDRIDFLLETHNDI